MRYQLADKLCSENAWLVIAGAGIGPDYMTMAVLNLVKCADAVYVETYTIPSSKWLIEYIRDYRKDSIIADRATLEDRSHILVEEARDSRVLVLVPGDPLIATTHRSLLVEAKRRGVNAKVIPGVSGVCAAKTASGLDYYRFGKTVTLPGPWRRVVPYSVYESLLGNLCLGLHTLMLLDIDGENQLHPCEALNLLRKAKAETPGILEMLYFILVERAGLEGERVRVFENWKGLCDVRDLRQPASIIAPGFVQPYEEEALRILYGFKGRTRSYYREVSLHACRLLQSIRGL